MEGSTLMFTSYPTYDPYRALYQPKVGSRLEGEDVYALQTALDGAGFDPNGLDGIFGPGTKAAVIAFQKDRKLTADGIAGPATQGSLVSHFSLKVREEVGLPSGLLYGQITHESGRILGNYSRPQRADGSFDAGVTQRNSNLHDVKESFNVPVSIQLLGETEMKYFWLFNGVQDIRRRWALAAGAWNAPAFACLLAYREGAAGVPASQRARTISAANLEKIEAYMTSVTAYLVL